MSFSKPKAPKPTQAQLDLEQSQRVASAQLDKQENERRKRLLAAAQGLRAYRGAPIARSAPGNRAGTVGFNSAVAAVPVANGGYSGESAAGSYTG